jgi:hypothetical protein
MFHGGLLREELKRASTSIDLRSRGRRSFAHDAPGDGLGDSDPVDGGGEDAAGIAGAFARGIQAFRVEALEGVVAGDPER